MADIDLRQSVLEELDFDPSFDAANIGVAVENGVVTLTGHVRSYAAKLAVERAVQRVKGVHGIAEENNSSFVMPLADSTPRRLAFPSHRHHASYLRSFMKIPHSPFRPCIP